MRVNKYIIAIAAGIFSLSMLSGCQSNKKADMNVSIQDGQVQTKLAVAKGSSVSDILKEAEITLNKKDQITPSLTTKLDSGEEKIEIARYEKLKVSDDNKEQEVEILGGKVKDVLEQAGITLGKHDIVNHDLEASCTDDMDIQVIRRVEVSLRADGKTKKTVTQAKTVKELLNENNIALSKKDRIRPALNKPLKEGTKVVVERVETRKEKKTEETAQDAAAADQQSADQQSETLQPNGTRPAMKLAGEAKTIARGTSFNALNEVTDAVDDKDDRDTLFRGLHIDGNYNVNQAGTYTLQYYVQDSDGNTSDPITFTLTVQ